MSNASFSYILRLVISTPPHNHQFLPYWVHCCGIYKESSNMSTGRELSIIIPSYNEQDNIQRTFQTIDEILTQNHIPYEIIFVDDGSKDLTFTRIQELSLQSGQVKGISFSRNFGKEAAIFAGLEKCRRRLLPDHGLRPPASPPAYS